MLLLQVFTLIVLFAIFYQDMKYRAVYWICFPLLALSLFLMKYQLSGLEQAITDALLVLAFLVVQFILLWGYFSLKNKQAINLTSSHLGWGDILFLLAIIFYLSPVNYLLFYVSSLMSVLVYALITKGLNKENHQRIPLAGLQALLLGAAISIDHFLPGFNLYDDSWIYV